MFLKKIREKAEKTSNVITSWITFNWTRVNGPPSSWKPIRLAGTWKQYSKKATPQLMRIIANMDGCKELFFPKKRRCPYQAIVMKVLERVRNPMVNKMDFISFAFRKVTKNYAPERRRHP
jgi:hypothetical protein